eukprot:CAMPEP_0176486252 /NCGR_PEP_ID=MMETSP0200_2-20121128/5469_1 /TAXON_ID=947934 /ORGANISM="Chaetoceros sp., Strain GSL56" /LENGTH=62 /DNA_ID=CAMNT_0017882941 /DNA_START=275 /DNA_END=463 /DNA_ORIENTATION=-
MATSYIPPTAADETNENYKCCIQIKLPSVTCAQQALEVLEVDQEIGDRVVKTLSVQDDLLLV